MARSAQNKKGFAIIEVVLAIGLALAMIVAFASLLYNAQKVESVSLANFYASTYVREEIEIATDLEQSNWNMLSTSTSLCGTICHPVASGTVWKLATGTEVLDGKYTRSLFVSSICRNPSLPLFPNVISGVTTSSFCSVGTIDPATKKVTATVSWNGGASTSTLTLETYVYKI